METDDYFLTRNFLTPHEGNISHLLDFIQLFQPEHDGANCARWLGAEGINYSSSSTDWNVPKQGLDEVALAAVVQQAFAGGVRWHSPSAMLNVTPPPLLSAVAASTLANLYNQNALWDFTSGSFLQIERKIVRALGDVTADFGPECGGVTVTGGKAAMAYAIKLGINRSESEAIDHGIRKRHLVFASERAHYSIERTLNQLGLGKSACVRVPCDDAGKIDCVKLQEALEVAVQAGACVSAVILSGGDTIDHVIDPIRGVTRLIDEFRLVHHLSYRPFIYADLVSGWIWTMFRTYDFVCNTLALSSEDLRFVQNKLAELDGLEGVDGLGVDLHKTGLCPYGTALFLCRVGLELSEIHGTKSIFESDSKFGDLHAHKFTFENSRSTAGIAAAWTALNGLGIQGIQAYAARLFHVNELIAAELRAVPDDFILLPRPDGWRATLFLPNFAGHGYDMSESDDARVYEFYARATDLVMHGTPDLPQLGIVPSYRLHGKKPMAVLMAYPMSLFTTPDSARASISALTALKKSMAGRCEKTVLSNRYDLPPR